MDPQTQRETRWSSIKSCLIITVDTMEILADTVNSSFLKPMSSTTRSLLTIAENVKSGKEECTGLLEDMYQLLNAIIALHMDSKNGGDFPPLVLNHLGNLIQTINRIYSFVQAQQESNRFKKLFRQSDTSALYKACRAGLQEGMDNFKVSSLNTQAQIEDMKKIAEARHGELLRLIEAQSAVDSTDGGSSTNHIFSSVYSSSNSLSSTLPSKPKIFHGRDSELTSVLSLFSHGTPKIAILGAGGMGKTSLARQVLHQAQITERFQDRTFFVSCESAMTIEELANLIAVQVGLDPSPAVRRQLLRRLSNGPPILLVLDNLETVWEPTESRLQVEEFLSLLTDIENLALMITMRGAERPAKIQWTRPFLPPLKPLSDEAAHKTFIDIADDIHPEKEVKKLLELTDNLPLAVTLVAHLVDTEGCPAVFSHWESEKTTGISEGLHKRSNLDISIALSLSSPRVTAEALQLLSLLSILPDGLSDVELSQAKLHISDQGRMVLLRTSLAYQTDQRRLKALVPIREYIQKFHPPAIDLVQPLLEHYEEVTQICMCQWGSAANTGVITRMRENFANIQNILQMVLQQDTLDQSAMARLILNLNSFSRRATCEVLPLMASVPRLLPQPMDHVLNISYLTEILVDPRLPAPDDSLINLALKNMHLIEDPGVKSSFYRALSWRHSGSNLNFAINICQEALDSLDLTKDPYNASALVFHSAFLKWRIADYAGGYADAKKALWLAGIAGHLERQATALHIGAKCLRGLGNYGLSLSLCQQAVKLCDLSNPSKGVTYFECMLGLAATHCAKSEYTDARDISLKMSQTISQQQQPYFRAGALLYLAENNITLGALPSDIQRDLDSAKAMFLNMHAQADVLLCDVSQAELDLGEASPASATERYTAIVQKSPGSVDLVTECFEKLNYAHRRVTSNWPKISLVHALKFKKYRAVHQALQFLGYNFLNQNDFMTAVNLFTTALDGFTWMDIHRSRAECMLELGEISRQKQDFGVAKEFWMTAKPLFERSSQNKQVRDIEERLAGLQRQADALSAGVHAEKFPENTSKAHSVLQPFH